MTNKQITARIRQIREQSGVCQEAVASAIDITVQSYSKIERGETQLSVERLYQISDFLKYRLKKYWDVSHDRFLTIALTNKEVATSPSTIQK